MKEVAPLLAAALLLTALPVCLGQQAGIDGTKPHGEASVPALQLTHETLPTDPMFEKLVIHYGRISSNVEGILMVAATDVRQELFQDPEWIAFAEKNKWALLLLDAVPAKRSPESALTPAAQRTQAAQSLGKHVFAWLDAHTETEAKPGDPPRSAPLPLLGYASGQGSFWLESLIVQQPKRFSAWLAVGASRFAALPQIDSFKFPPGCLLALTEGQHATHLDHFEDLRADNKANLISYVRWETRGTSTSAVDAFARLFLDTAVHASPEQHRWANVHTLALEPADGRLSDPVTVAWYPSMEVIGAAAALRPMVLPKPAAPFVRKSFSTPEFTSCELHWMRMVPKPRAVLLIANNPLPTAIRHMPEWMNYAKERQWAILLMSLTQGKIRSEEDAMKGLEARLYDEIDSMAGPETKGLPLITYAQGATGGWLQALILRQPHRYLAWATANVTRFPALTTAVKSPPGLLISAQESEYRPQLYHFEDLRSADPYNPACLLRLCDPLPPSSWIETGIRSFLDGAVNEKKEANCWLHLHDLTAPSRSLASKQDPKTYAWFPSAEVAGIWKTLREQTEAMPLPAIAKRSFKTRIPEAPELKLFIRLPAGVKKGEPVGGVLCFCGWQEEDSPLVNRLKNANDFLVRFADRNNLAMITWNSPGMVPARVLTELSEEDELKLDGKFAAFSEAWEGSIKKVCQEFQFRNNGMLLYGLSRGSRYVHNIAMRYPEQFLAVHTHIGGRYHLPFLKEARETLWLATTGEVDPGSAQSLAFYEKGVEQKIPILFKAGESLGHDIRRDIEELSAAFFANALELQRDCEKRRSKDRRSTVTPASLFTQQMAAPPYFGDLINHEIVTTADAANWWVPVSQRIALPTEAIAKAWGMSLEQATAKVGVRAAFSVAPVNAPAPEPATKK